MTKTRFLLTSFIALILALTPLAAMAGSTLDAIRSHGVLRIGLTGDYRPFSAFDPKSGQWSGMDVEMGKALAISLGVTPLFVHTSWPNLSADLERGKFDIGMGGISVTAERARIGLFSTPILSDGKTPIARCENQSHFQTLTQIDRRGIRVIVNPGGTNERFARAHIQKAELILHSDNRSIFDEIIAGRADLMITDGTEARLQARIHPELCAIHPDTPFDHADKAYLMQPDEDLHKTVEGFLLEMRRSGALKSMIDRWVNGAQKAGE